jgi:hypothetical protein
MLSDEDESPIEDEIPKEEEDSSSELFLLEQAKIKKEPITVTKTQKRFILTPD